MLTIQIEDAQLERLIIEKAKSIGQTAQEFLKDLAVKETKTIDKLPFEIPRLDYRNHITIIDYELTEEEELLATDDSVPLFAHITDSAKYVHDMRRKSRN
jgi:hypothetical protein